MRRFPRVLACALVVLVAACERIYPPEDSKTDPGASASDAPAFVRADPRLSAAHSGIRKLEFASEAGPSQFFRERIATDGQGRFSVQPIGPEGSSVRDWDSFELTQHAREGFLFRYRDFVVRDARLFEKNWVLTARGVSQVAGRACHDYRVERTLGEPVSFELSIDDGTGLVLACRESDAAGKHVASMVYEHFELAMEPGAIAWHVPTNQEAPLTSQESLEGEVGRRLLQPRLMPNGYAPLESATVSDGNDARWIKRTYSDGIEPLFFLERLEHRPVGAPLGDPRQSDPGQSDPRQSDPGQGDPRAGAVPESTSAVVVFKLGPTTVIQGEIDGHEVIAIGRVSEAELLDFLESSLP